MEQLNKIPFIIDKNSLNQKMRVMKIYKLFMISLTVVAAITLQSCGEEEFDDGVVDFTEAAINRTTDDLSDVTVELTIDPAAPVASNIYVSVSGAEYGTVFTTTPAASGGQVMIPVALDATSASMTVSLDEEGIGFDDVVLTLKMDSTSNGLTTGIVTTMSINIANAKDKGAALPFQEDFDGCTEGGDGEPIPEGWEQIVAQQNAEGSATWECVNESFFGFGGVEANCFVPGSEDLTSSEVWLVSPRINLTEATAPALSFDVDRRFDPTETFTEDHYDILISSDYTGLNFSEATWTRFQAGYDAMTANDPGTDDPENTGALDLSDYAGEIVAIAFVYRAGAPGSFDATILRIANVSVVDE
jgi:hypothetical protein